MKNNKGFTLVELLAVIAIMAILLIIALPNVLKMFNESKEKIFLTESKSVFKEAINQTIKDRNFSDVIYCKSMNDEVNLLDMSGRDIYYYIKANVNDKLLDEPTSALDPGTINDLLELLNELSKTTTIVVVSHDMDLIKNYADKVLFLKDGEIVKYGAPKEILSSDNEIVQEFLGKK